MEMGVALCAKDGAADRVGVAAGADSRVAEVEDVTQEREGAREHR